MGLSSDVATPKFTPSWVRGMRPHRWYAISGDVPDLGLEPTRPGTRFLVDTDPGRDPELNPPRTLKERLRRAAGRAPKSPWCGVNGFSSVTEAWNGSVFASRYGHSGAMIIFGGGHNDYFGSSVHAFDLASREWTRLTDGYIGGRAAEYGPGARYPDAVYPDGSPLPPHTYGYVQYDAVGNDYILLKGQIQLGPDVEAVPIPHLFNLEALRWRHGPRHPTAILNSGGWSTWDASRRTLWGHSGDDGGGNAFIGFSPDGANRDGTWGRWTERFPNKMPGIANHNAMQIDPLSGVIVIALHRRNDLYVIDPADPGRDIARLESSGAKPALQPCATMEFAANLEAIVYFSAADGGAVYHVAPAHPHDRRRGFQEKPWQWGVVPIAAGTLDPIADAARRTRFPANVHQTFGRFRVATFGTVDLAVLVRHVDTPVYAMRLT